MRYGPPDGDSVVDVLTRLGTAFRFEDLESETTLVDGVGVRVATPRTLLLMNQRTLRAVDQADAAALAKKFGLEAR